MSEHQNEIWRSGWRTLLGIFLAVFVVAAPRIAPADEPRGHQPDLTMDRRIACQRAIEQVYWQHRIWPAENAGAKPSLDVVFSSEQLADRVRDGLRKSAALEIYWNRPITATQIDAEVRRMANDTRAPDRLRELWTALDDDPLLVAECLARPLLADRLIRHSYNFDKRFRVPLRADAEDNLEGYGAIERQPDSLRQVSTASDKIPFEQWWSATKSTLPALMDVVASGAALPEIAEEGCNDNTWNPMRYLPKERDGHIAVWTGSEMIIWGGAFCEGVDSEIPGGRYDPATDSWIAINANNPPANRHGASGVWTGTEMIVWGGWACLSSDNVKNTGGRYNPTTDEWTPTSILGNVPNQRADHTAVWTGTEMIVWGGTSLFGWCPGGGEACTDTGGGYDPNTDSWTPITLEGAPVGRRAHTAVWTGSEMIIWGGERSLQSLNDGARYNPILDTWTSTSMADAPVGRVRHTTIWTGSEMVVWGGCNDRGCFFPNLDSGGRYDPLTDAWTPTNLVDSPSPRHDHAAVWTGSEIIVWGGCVDADCDDFRANGGRYNPVTDVWTPTATTGAPGARAQHTAVWTGSEMIVWGGCHGGECVIELQSGGRYDPNTDSWVPTSTESGPLRRINHSAIWTGSELIIWGGLSTFLLADGMRYDPSTDHWTIMNSLTQRRERHTAVWTGSEMIVWSGSVFGQGVSVTGTRYDPQADTWTEMSFIDAPAGRTGHAAVWTGTKMIVWGGTNGTAFDTGGSYDPVADTWVATTTVNAPSARFDHTGVWSGSEMIVWGGRPDFLTEIDTGGRYDPVADIWSPVETIGAPGARSDHTAVWTDTEMIVWGGENSGIALGDGERYHPTTDSWTPVSMASAPGPRTLHAAVWTGTEMILWGGDDGDVLRTGGRYDPAADAWRLTTTGPYTPVARARHTATWGDKQMFVFGGLSTKTEPGAAYCAEATAAPPDAIPAMSDWGVVTLALLTLCAGSIIVRRQGVCGRRMLEG